jgi:predicted RNA-binding Zn-ribbon protein involved in translation (DUF1610 family)
MPDERSPADPAKLAIDADLRRWRAAHPAATFTEIEQAVDARMRAVRADLLAELAGAEGDAAPRCPACGHGLVQRGTHTRTLWTQGEAPVALTRSYATCPACGAGLFPPR